MHEAAALQVTCPAALLTLTGQLFSLLQRCSAHLLSTLCNPSAVPPS